MTTRENAYTKRPHAFFDCRVPYKPTRAMSVPCYAAGLASFTPGGEVAVMLHPWVGRGRVAEIAHSLAAAGGAPPSERECIRQLVAALPPAKRPDTNTPATALIRAGSWHTWRDAASRLQREVELVGMLQEPHRRAP
jgi:hypothetical protein